MREFVISEEIVITLNDGVFGLWNLNTGEQYEIFEKTYLDRIFELTEYSHLPYQAQPEDELLIEAGILLLADQALDYKKLAAERGKWGWDLISKIFHYGSKHNFPSEISKLEDTESGYIDFCQSIEDTMPDLETEREGKIITLPDYNGAPIQNMNLQGALWERRTSRNFRSDAVPVSIVADILYSTFGAIHGDSHKEEMEKRGIRTVGYRRSSPSAGCLQATEAYLIALNVDGLSRGIYHYRSHQHVLTEIDLVIDPSLEKILCYQSFAIEASFLIVLTTRFDKLWWKYPHSRAYRSGLLDVGHLSQTFNLVTTAYSLNTWVTGYFIDNLLNDLIKVDGFKEQSIFVMAGGPGYSDPLSPGVLQLLNSNP
ncbi:SagB/ThcOx family dehydrogenase [Pseudomonas sp. 10B1]|uniref:SagB/ThcOx family dehydrogenase n=1 Tax=unclassified Pseudomonas TaxID=196821 RepID=UPI002AB51FA8|nr:MULTISPECIES: SagB/ThcOx family dehydrogenase [unclassified Pseudomonas]MDY7559102.1 SagB/ThcOx family dehydrogenase [Pseudomonas sp. AB6]MEA9997417.1 SagB/ThcOx family dehydrogenase [Pseudomonas sp. AA4]MEB0087714.1 SagB/ThcOx family dehydrogenase [Pseudomonas sp. RTI1]MEB0124836.1 SagB/ThcOx family dehydrogenase [Pseudomonas sp. CCC1.2]MEB0155801.1 SagB/ThcOx family dehydrogenase [Pseudomonas sp. CCC4.3]